MRSAHSPAAELRRPRFDRLRTRLGYRFPRLGPLAFKSFFALALCCNLAEISSGIIIEMNFEDLTHCAIYCQGERFEWPMAEALTLVDPSAMPHFL